MNEILELMAAELARARPPAELARLLGFTARQVRVIESDRRTEPPDRAPARAG